MDADQLSRIQDSGARIRCGAVTGHIAGFRIVGDAIRSLSLRDADGLERVVHGDIELVDEVDDEKVAAVRAQREAEHDAFFAGTAVGAIRDAAKEA